MGCGRRSRRGKLSYNNTVTNVYRLWESIMSKYPLLLLCCALAAACGKSDAPQNGAAAETAPKPLFKLKFIDQTVIGGLDLDAPSEGKTEEGKKRVVYPLKGMGEGNQIELIGEHPNDLEALHGKCMETDGAGKNTGWEAEGTCRTLFAKLVDNIADDGAKLTDYLVGHAALTPYSEQKSGYAAVQNGRYVLELDSEGAFYFRRRHY